MKDGIEKLINHLETERERFSKINKSIKCIYIGKDITNFHVKSYDRKTTDRELAINFILPRVKMSDTEYLDHMEIFQIFNELSIFIEEAHLSPNEAFNLVMYMIRRNLMCIKKTSYTTAINDRALRGQKLDNISPKELEELISEGRISQLYNAEDSELTPREIEIRESLKSCDYKIFTDIKPIIDNHLAIEKHYFDKLPDIQQEDIQIICDSLNNLGFSSKVCSMINHELSANFYTKPISANILSHERAKSTEPTHNREKPAEQKEPLKIDHKEYKKSYNKIREYFNIPKRELIKDVSYEEMIEIVSMMLKINLDGKSIRNFIRLALERLSKEELNPSIKYQSFKAKLVNYLSEEQIAYLDELNEAFQSDNSFWQDSFMEYLDSILAYVEEFDDYSYELNQAQQLLKTNNSK